VLLRWWRQTEPAASVNHHLYHADGVQRVACWDSDLCLDMLDISLVLFSTSHVLVIILCICIFWFVSTAVCCLGGKAPAGAARLALTLDGSESEEQLAQVNSVDAVVALLNIQVGGRGNDGWGADMPAEKLIKEWQMAYE
jgi:hypothetical protein